MSRDAVGFWKYVATSAVTGLAFVGFAYFAGANDWVTRAEVTRIAGPYTQERELILHQLKVSGEQITALQSLMQDSVRQQAELRAEVRTLVDVLNEDRAGK